MEGYGWRRKYNVWHGTMYSGYGNDCARDEGLCVSEYIARMCARIPRVCAYVRPH